MPIALPEDLWQERNPQNPKPDIQNIRVAIRSFCEANREGTVMTPKNVLVQVTQCDTQFFLENVVPPQNLWAATRSTNANHIVIDAFKHQAQGRPLHLAKEQQHKTQMAKMQLFL